jgi:hypothetical protein
MRGDVDEAVHQMARRETIHYEGLNRQEVKIRRRTEHFDGKYAIERREKRINQSNEQKNAAKTSGDGLDRMLGRKLGSAGLGSRRANVFRIRNEEVFRSAGP